MTYSANTQQRVKRAGSRKTGYLLALAVLSALPVSVAGASDDSAFYLGAAYGQARVNDSDFDDDNTAIKVFVGGKFNPYFGAEVAVSDYGDSGSNGFSSDLKGTTLALVGYLPFTDRFELFAKGGRLWWRDKFSFGDSFSDSMSGSENFYGAGVNFGLGENFSLRVELERYKVDLSVDEIGFEVDGSSTVDVASVGVALYF